MIPGRQSYQYSDLDQHVDFRPSVAQAEPPIQQQPSKNFHDNGSLQQFLNMMPAKTVDDKQRRRTSKKKRNGSRAGFNKSRSSSTAGYM